MNVFRSNCQQIMRDFEISKNSVASKKKKKKKLYSNFYAEEPKKV